jgi:tRNA threonylcarbamoyladenosine biosynthesis protein TsaE
MTIEFVSRSPADTLAAGRHMAQLLRPGDIVVLAGRLGSGKTLFASGVAEGLGVEEPVTSPTFVLVRTYAGFFPLVHADVYRLASLGEFVDLELLDAARDGVVLIEWGNAVENDLPPDHIVVEIEMIGEEERRFRIVPRGAAATRSFREAAP